MATKLKTAANAVTQPQPQPQPQPQRKSNAQRQADYRARHLKDVNGKLDRVVCWWIFMPNAPWSAWPAVTV